MKRPLVLLFLTLVVYGRCQQLHFFKPDNLSQLPSSESYNVFQDSKGYIWFSTEAGLCRYNGSEIKVFNAKNGLPEEACYGIAEDRQGKLWLITSQRRILTYWNDTLAEAKWSRKFTAQLQNDLVQLYAIQIESDTQMWLCSQYKTFVVNPLTGRFRQVKVEAQHAAGFYMNEKCLVPLKNDTLTPEFESMLHKNRQYPFHVRYFGKDIKFSIPYRAHQIPSWRVLTALNNKGEGFIGMDTLLLKITPGLKCQVYIVPHTILQLYCDKDDGLYVCTNKGGLEYYPNGDLRRENRITALSDLTPTGVCEDHEGGLWCTTLEKGILYCRNKKVLVYLNVKGLDKRAGLLAVRQNKVFVSSAAAEIFEIEGNEISRHQVDHPPVSALADIIDKDKGWYIISKSFCSFATQDFKKQQPVRMKGVGSIVGGSQLERWRGNRLFFIAFGTLGEIDKLEQWYTVGPVPSPARCLHYTSTGKMLVALKSGLFQMNAEENGLVPLQGFTENITRLAEDSDGSVWATTKGDGVFILQKDGSVYNLCDSLNLGTRRFFDVSVDRYGSIWLASNLGLTRLRKYEGRYFGKTFNMFNGLPSNEIFRIVADSAHLYMSAYDGLCRFPLTADLSNLAPPVVRINSIRVNDNPVMNIDQLNLPYNQNTLKIRFDILTFKQAGTSPLLVYYVAGLDTNVHFIREKSLILGNLPPGAYRLFAFAANNDGVLNKAPLVMSFMIARPWWKHPWVIALGSLALLVSGYLGIRKVVQRVRDKEREKARIDRMLTDFHMSALRAQMNPHFIFNCINSIQRFVITNKAEEAYNYLAKFSKLIRLVLTYAEENFITLAQELEVTTLYLELEQLRVQERFTYTINCAVDANEVEVPVMMLQPYVENAIWHGIMNLPAQKKGQITVSIAWLEPGELLQVVVEDNGVGREEAARLSKNSHISKSTNINRKRMEMMKLMSRGDAGRITTEDILDEHNSVTGTRVIMRIPQQQEIYEHN